MSDQPNTIKRSPVVAIMGHVDHGKSSLLDYIRKTNIIADEAGGITQHLSAYQVTHSTDGTDHQITFIDTPGHAAFSGMRKRTSTLADLAILIVSAEDGVKTQTIEAIELIKTNNIPFVVAINKIDLPNANIERTKTSLMEHGVYLEGFGGDISYAEISAKSGTGVDELLDIIILTAELEDFTGDTSLPAEGFVIESHLDVKRGISATLIIKNGTINKGDFIVAGKSIASTRLLEDFLGNKIDSATFSSPVTVTGFDSIPEAGSLFISCNNKKHAEHTATECILAMEKNIEARTRVHSEEERFIVPVIIKTDVTGTKEAVENEIAKVTNDDVLIKIVRSEVGSVNESDIYMALTDKNSIILTFNTNIDKSASEVNGFDNVNIKEFSVIYHLTEWLTTWVEENRPKKQVESVTGEAKVLKVFSSNKGNHLIGCKVTEGSLKLGVKLKVERDGEKLGYGKFDTIKRAGADTDTVLTGDEFGGMFSGNISFNEDDKVIAFIEELK